MQSVLGFLVVAIVLLLAVPSHGQEGLTKIKSIDIRGNTRIDAGAIRDRLTVKVDDPYTEAAIRTQIQLLYDMGFFEDVEIQTEPVPGGTGVVVIVREKPFIAEIVFDGNKELKEGDLRERITLQSQTFLDQQRIKESAKRIEQAYRDDAFYNAEVIPIVQSLEEDRRRVTFYIKEGEQTKIESVVFLGAEAVPKDDLLDLMANRETVFLMSWFSDAGILKREELPNDVERIRRVYMNQGYLNVRVSQPTVELTDDKQGLVLTFLVEEGERYAFSGVTYSGNTVFEDAELRVGTKIIPGDMFKADLMIEERARIEDLYGARGYSFAEVDFQVEPKKADQTVALAFRIDEGKLMRIRRIRITGNDKTRDNVIRRELRVSEQQVIDTVAMKRSFQRLNNLDFFETVEILPTQVSDDKVDLDVKVKEKPTGSFSVGGGFSTLDKFTLIANIRERNLFGRGYLLAIRGQLGQRRTLGVVTLRDPRFRDSDTSLQVDVYRTDTDLQTYTEDKRGGSLGVGRSFSEFVYGTFSLFGEELDISEVSTDAAEIIKEQEGTQSTTGFRSWLSRDTRDFIVDPRMGWKHGVGFDFASKVFGGSNFFYKARWDSLKYTPLFWDVRHMIRGRAGIVEGLGGQDAPVSERFFVGGINTMRGFKFGRAGPVTVSGDPEGADRQIIINNDLIVPLSREAKLNGVLFLDYGTGWAEGEGINLLDLRRAAGFEVRWLSPFGPFRAAYGWNLDRQDGEKKTVFEFTVGGIF